MRAIWLLLAIALAASLALVAPVAGALRVTADAHAASARPGEAVAYRLTLENTEPEEVRVRFALEQPPSYVTVHVPPAIVLPAAEADAPAMREVELAAIAPSDAGTSVTFTLRVTAVDFSETLQFLLTAQNVSVPGVPPPLVALALAMMALGARRARSEP